MVNCIRRTACAALLLQLIGCGGGRLSLLDDPLYERVVDVDRFPGDSDRLSTTSPFKAGSAPVTVRLPDDGRLTLDQAIRIALLNHPDLRRSASAVRAASGRELQVGLYPNPKFAIEAESLGSDAGDGGETAFLFAQEIVMAGKRRKSQAVARADRYIQQAALRATAFAVMTRVRSAFSRAAAAEDRLTAERELLGLADELLDAAVRQVDAGAATETDRLRAQVVREQASIDFHAAETASQATRRSLASALGLDTPLTISIIMDLSLLPQLPDRDKTVELVLMHNADLKRARLAIERAGRAYELARSRAIPNIVATVGPRFSDIENETTLDAGFEVAIPIFDRNQGDIAVAIAQRIGAGATLRSVRLRLMERVAKARSAFETAHYAATQYSITLLPMAQRTLELTREAYRAGKTDYLRLLDAQQTFIRSRIAYIDALEALHESAAILEGLMQRDMPWSVESNDSLEMTP